MKPRIRPLPKRAKFDYLKFECQGLIPGTKLEGWGYGRTIAEAYANWLESPIPF